MRPFIWLAQLSVLALLFGGFAVRTTKHYDLRQDPLPRFGHTRVLVAIAIVVIVANSDYIRVVRNIH